MSVTLQIPFTTGTDSEYTFGSEIEIAGNQVQLVSAGTAIPYTEDFNDALGLTFGAGVEISGGVQAQLALQSDPGNDFIENFTNDTNFTYNASYTEFVAGQVQQKDQRPTGATCLATFTTNINLNDGGGVLTGTAFGGASVLAGKLDLKYNDTRYATYPALGNASTMIQQGCIRLKYTPNYSGTPASDRSIISIGTPGSGNNHILLGHLSGTGNLFVYIYDNTGVARVNLNTGAWSPVSGTTYELEINFDLTAGATRLFIDGNQFGGTDASTATRDNTFTTIAVGSNINGSQTSNFSIDDLVIFDTVQHTANYVSGYSLPEARYLADMITLPEMENTNPGTIVSFDSFTTTEAGSPRYTIQIGRSGNYLYWDGAAWSVSNNTYAQANDKVTFNANVATLPVNGETYDQFRLYTTNGSSQTSVDVLTASMTLQLYSVSNDTIDLDTAITSIGYGIISWTSFTETIIAGGSDAVKYVLSDDNGATYKYWDGGAWSVSAGYANSNTGADVNTNIASFPITTDGMKIKVYLHSNDGTTTPSIGNLVVDFDDAVYPTSNPSIVYNTSFSTDALESFTETSTKNGSDEIKYILTKDAANYYWTGVAWAASDGTYAQSNTAAEITTNIATFTVVRTTVTITAFLHSDDGSTTPQLDNLQIVYSYGGETPDTVETAEIFGFNYDSQGNPDTTAFKVFLKEPFVKYKTNITMTRNIITVTPDATGYWEVTLAETTNMDGDQYWVFEFENYTALRQIPNTVTVYDFEDL